MKDDTPSRTAAWVAGARHLGRLLPEDVRLADDPFGAYFTSTMLARGIEQAIEAAPPDLSLAGALRAIRHPATRMPGLRAWILYMQVRTRVIDDALRAFCDAGGNQVVVLGAGYDCRALRMPELDDTRVFEIDHPATQGHKRSVLDRLGIDRHSATLRVGARSGEAGPIDSPVTYVAWDFESRPLDDLPDELAATGHDASQPTFTIWEGVTMYLTEPAIDASLRAIATWSAPRSVLAMTYFAKTRIAKPTLATRAIQAIVSTVGEPWRWGWAPEELPEYLRERGLEVVDDVSLADAARMLLPPELAVYVSDGDRRVALAAAPESIAVCTRS